MTCFNSCAVILLGLTFLAGCQSPSPPAAGHVNYGMSAILDGKPLPALEAITAESCYDGYGGYSLAFAAEADMDPQSIDDEIALSLNIKIDGGSQMTVGKPMEVMNNTYIHLSANTTAFLPPPPPQDPVTTATGTLSLTALSAREMSGSASLTFTDPADVNPVLRDSLVYEVTFTNLAIVHYCPES